MPYSITINQDLELVIGRFYDLLDGPQLNSYLNEMDSRGPFPESFDLLFFIEPNTKIDVKINSVRESAKRRPTFGREAQRIIVTKDPLAFGLSRVYASESVVAWDQYQVVSDLESAANLLGKDAVTLISGLRKLAGGD